MYDLGRGLQWLQRCEVGYQRRNRTAQSAVGQVPANQTISVSELKCIPDTLDQNDLEKPIFWYNSQRNNPRIISGVDAAFQAFPGEVAWNTGIAHPIPLHLKPFSDLCHGLSWDFIQSGAPRVRINTRRELLGPASKDELTGRTQVARFRGPAD